MLQRMHSLFVRLLKCSFYLIIYIYNIYMRFNKKKLMYNEGDECILCNDNIYI